MAAKTLLINNLTFTLEAACAAADNFISLPSAIMEKLRAKGLPDLATLTFPTLSMSLTLADPKTGAWEVVTIYAYQADQVYAMRGSEAENGEGEARAWPAGTLAYQALTAGDIATMNSLMNYALDASGALMGSGINELGDKLDLEDNRWRATGGVLQWRTVASEALNVYGAVIRATDYGLGAWRKMTILLENAGSAPRLVFDFPSYLQVAFVPGSGVKITNNQASVPLATNGLYRVVLENVASGFLAVSVEPLERLV